MNSENIEPQKEKVKEKEKNSENENLKYKTNSFNIFKSNLQLNANKNNNNTLKNPYTKKMNLSLENNDSELEHPLVFYALSKIKNKNKMINNNNLALYTSQGFRSSSNDMIKRNMFSINASCFDNMKKNKEYSTIKKQILEDNNYLNPIKIYKSFHKYDVDNNCINQETFNLTKKKYYSRDRLSKIKTGLYLTKKEFYEQKKKLLENKNKYKTINTDINIDSTKNDDNNEINNNKDNKYYFKDPTDYTKEELMSKNWRFDRNYKMFIKHKNWWKCDKYVK